MIRKIMFLLCCGILFTVSAQTIIISDTASQTEKKAAQELLEHLSKALGRKVVLQKEGKAFSGTAIYIGKTKFSKQKGIDFDKFDKEEWLIKSFGKNLVVGGGQPRGVIYATLELLERQFGVLWLDEYYTYVPKISEIKWDTNLNLRGKPAFDIRGIYAYHHSPKKDRQVFMARNRQNLFHDEKSTPYLQSRGVYRIFGSPRACHTYYNYTKDWEPENENCFSLSKAGKRLRAVNASGPGQVCFSNPKTRKLFSAKLRKFIQADRAKSSDGNYPVIYDISVNDNSHECVCEKCLAAAKKYGSYGGLVLEFTNAIADSIARDYPDVKVQMFAYLFAQKVPKNIKASSNVVIRLAQIGVELTGNHDTLRSLSHPNNKQCKLQVLEWNKIGTLSMWDYWIMYQKTEVEASSCTAAMIENIRFYRNLKVKSLFVESERPLRTSFYALRLWLGFRLMNNPDLNAAEQIDNFMNAYYGPAGPIMNTLLQYLERRNSEIKANLAIPLKLRIDLDDAFFTKADKLLQAARAKVVGQTDYLRHIAKEQLVVDYARLGRMACLKPFNQELVIKRLERNYSSVCKDYYSGTGVQKAMKRLQRFLDGLRLKISHPANFKNTKIAIDLTWPKLQDHIKSKLTNVYDAAGGKAIVLKNFKDTGDLKFGFYSRDNKKNARYINIKRKDLVQDEKFHFYSIGAVTLTPNCYVWAHPTWYIQRKLNEFYQPGGNNVYKIFISIKAEGPAYVKDSKKDNALMVDRILLIRPKK